MKFKFFAFFMGMLFMSSILGAKSSVDIDKDFYYGSGDLGLSLTDSTAVFKCWAPLAKSVKEAEKISEEQKEKLEKKSNPNANAK